MLSEADGAFAFIDKHDQAARQLADNRSCIYWRPADLSHPVGFNPLDKWQSCSKPRKSTLRCCSTAMTRSRRRELKDNIASSKPNDFKDFGEK